MIFKLIKKIINKIKKDRENYRECSQKTCSQELNEVWKKSYSQDGEDMILSSFYEATPEYEGFYVDIGALDPFRFSNTQFFYENGWHGINIDASPNSMDKFNKFRVKDINLELGVANKSGEMTYYSFEEPAYNSFSEEISEQRIDSGLILIEKIKIKTNTINEILKKYLPKNQSIDFINIDVEGLELSILKQFDFKKYTPKYFLIEDLDYVKKDFVEYIESPIYKLLKNENYITVAKTSRTIIFKKNE